MQDGQFEVGRKAGGGRGTFSLLLLCVATTLRCLKCVVSSVLSQAVGLRFVRGEQTFMPGPGADSGPARVDRCRRSGQRAEAMGSK